MMRFFRTSNFLEKTIKNWMKAFSERIKILWSDWKIKWEELNWKYNRIDNTNLYAYKFFSKFPNIETVKFPTRWRSSMEKLNFITEVIEKDIDPFDFVTATTSLDRQNYDFTHLFWEDDWFRNLLIKVYDKK